MSLIELLGQKVMLFTSERVAVNRKSLLLIWIVTTFLRSAQEVQNIHLQVKDKSAILVRQHYFFSGPSNVLPPMRCG